MKPMLKCIRVKVIEEIGETFCGSLIQVNDSSKELQFIYEKRH